MVLTSRTNPNTTGNGNIKDNIMLVICDQKDVCSQWGVCGGSIPHEEGEWCNSCPIYPHAKCVPCKPDEE